jgi:hypothetical protein
MTAVSVLTVIACVITGALMVRYGNLAALRKQRAENSSQAARRLWTEREQELHTSLEVLDALAQKRKQGLLEISEESWLQLVGLQRSHPEYLEELLLLLEVHAHRHDTSGRAAPIRVMSSEEVVASKKE